MYIYKILQNNLINNILFTMFFGVQNNLINNLFLPCSMKYKIIKSARYFYHTPWSTKNNSITIIYFLPYSLKKKKILFNNIFFTMFFNVQNISYNNTRIFFTMFIEEHIHKMSTNQISAFTEMFVPFDQYVHNIKII